MSFGESISEDVNAAGENVKSQHANSTLFKEIVAATLCGCCRVDKRGVVVYHFIFYHVSSIWMRSGYTSTNVINHYNSNIRSHINIQLCHSLGSTVRSVKHCVLLFMLHTCRSKFDTPFLGVGYRNDVGTQMRTVHSAGAYLH